MLITAGCNAGEKEVNPEMKPISCELQIDEVFSLGAPVLVNFSLSNNSESAFEVLQYHTPLEDLLGPVFEIRFGDELLPYDGPMVKRGPPTDDDWLLLKPASKLGNELDAGLAWVMDKKGQYSLNLRRDISYRAAGSKNILSLPATSCGTVFFSIE